MLRSGFQRFFVLAFIFGLLLSACSHGGASSSYGSQGSASHTSDLLTSTHQVQTPLPTEEIFPTALHTKPTSQQASPPVTAVPQTIKNPSYELSAELDYDNHTLAVTERINYVNNSPEPIQDLLLMVEPAY